MSDNTVSVRITSDTHYDGDKLVPKGTVLNGISKRTADHLVTLGAAEPATVPATVPAINKSTMGGAD